MIVYLSGHIAGVEDYPIAFGHAARCLEEKHPDWVIINPASLPVDLPAARAMAIDMAMLAQADAICLMQGWEHSAGCRIEHAYAIRTQMDILMYKEALE